MMVDQGEKVAEGNGRHWLNCREPCESRNDRSSLVADPRHLGDAGDERVHPPAKFHFHDSGLTQTDLVGPSRFLCLRLRLNEKNSSFRMTTLHGCCISSYNRHSCRRIGISEKKLLAA